MEGKTFLVCMPELVIHIQESLLYIIAEYMILQHAYNNYYIIYICDTYNTYTVNIA